MKKIIGAVAALAVVALIGAGAWFGYHAVFTDPVAYYAQVDADCLTQAGENNNDFAYHYDLPAASADGKTETLGFDTSRELRDGAYLKLDTLVLRGVVHWEEVSWEDIPAPAQAKLPAPAPESAEPALAGA